MPLQHARSFVQSRPGVCLALLLLLQAGLLGYSATRHSPGLDEVGHLAAGLHHWKSGTFDLYRVNPPLVRLVATAPLILMGLELPDMTISIAPATRSEFPLGQALFEQYGERTFGYLTIARWACIPFALLGTAIIYRWGTELFGRVAGLFSATLWVFCPTILANGQMITPDTGAASLGITACYFFWRWIRHPGWMTALFAGVLLGLAALTKLTWILLPVFWLITWLIVIIRNAARTVTISRWGEMRQLIVIFLVALYVVNAGYGFEDTGRPLGQYQFLSQPLTNETETEVRVNRFRDTWLGAIPVPLPRNYVQSLDFLKRVLEAKSASYLRGEWRNQGWWYYYLYGLWVKTPIGTLLIFGFAMLSCLLPCRPLPGWRDELLLLLPGLAVLTFVSSQTGYNHHLRYILPALPFLFVWLGRVVTYAGPWRLLWRLTIGIAMLGTIISSLRVYPHSMSYFNEVAGGPTRGSEHLVDSNIDWGQDLLHLKQWLNEHPDAQPLGFVYYGFIDPRVAGIEFTLPPKGPTTPSDYLEPRRDKLGPQPGWYAISVTLLQGQRFALQNAAGRSESVKEDDYAYFHRFRPVAMAGYSIWIYHLEPDECNRVRREMGLHALD